MNKRTSIITSVALAMLATTSISVAETTDQKLKKLEIQMQQLRGQVNATADKVDASSSSLGMGGSKTHISGYGELHYNNLKNDDGSKKKKALDFHRFVLEFGHDFTDKTRFFSEMELEHSIAGDGKKGEIELEQAYIQHDITSNISASAGVMLIPVGLMNETHEPPNFYGVERNPVEKNIIPATWWAGAIGISGKTGMGLSYDAMIHEGLNIPDDGKFKIRSGRQKTSKASANNLAYTGRLKYTGLAGVELGLTMQHQANYMQGAASGGVANLIETHAAVNKGPLSVKALYAQWNLKGSAAKVAQKNKQKGGYLEVGYKVTPQIGLFTRHGQWDNGGAGDTKMTQNDFGVNYWLNKKVVLKADYQQQSGGSAISKSKTFDGFNLGVGYQF